MRNARTRTIAALGAVAALTVTGFAPASAGGGHDHDHGHGHGHGHGDFDDLSTVVEGLDGPRGVDALGHGMTLVTETDGTFSLVVERKHRDPKVIELGQVEVSFAPAIAAGRHGTVWLLTGAEDPEGPNADNGAKLFRWRPGMDDPEVVADIAAYQATDPDPYDLEDFPEDSNPFGLAALHHGGVLVADAAGNDLLRVSRDGDIETVARLKPREVEVPEGLPEAGTMTMAEAVATSVTIGEDGSWYVGELRGYPGTAGTSEIWRIRPGTTDAVCDPEHPWGSCKRHADGLTSIMDLGSSRDGILAVTLSKQTWLAIEGDPPAPGSEIGGLFLVKKRHHHGHHGSTKIKELVPDQLVLPGGVDVSGDQAYVVGPVFGPGSLMRID